MEASLGLALRQWMRLGALAALLVLSSCTGKGASTRPAIEVVDSPTRAGFERVLVVMPASVEFDVVRKSLKEEISEDFDVVTVLVGEESGPELFAAAIAEHKPACLVLMNNRTAMLYEAFQAAQPPDVPMPPAIVIMASFVSRVETRLRNATGIAYEVPAVTVMVNLRSFLSRPIERVGVVYRGPLHTYVREQASMAQMEQIQIVGVELPAKPKVGELKAALRALAKVHKVDAYWVLSDNVLLSRKMLRDAWIPFVRKASLPVTVGVSGLVNSKVSFGTFAMLPDHVAMGVQVANTIYDLSEDSWSTEGRGVEQPLSIKTVVDLPQAKAKFGVSDAILKRIDRIVE